MVLNSFSLFSGLRSKLDTVRFFAVYALPILDSSACASYDKTASQPIALHSIEGKALISQGIYENMGNDKCRAPLGQSPLLAVIHAIEFPGVLCEPSEKVFLRSLGSRDILAIIEIFRDILPRQRLLRRKQTLSCKGIAQEDHCRSQSLFVRNMWRPSAQAWQRLWAASFLLPELRARDRLFHTQE